MDQHWRQVLSLQFGLKLVKDEGAEWMRELRRSVSGWGHNPQVEGDDPLTGETIKRINHELCEAIRHAAGAGAKEKLYGKPAVSDLIEWVMRYRKRQSYKSDHNSAPVVKATMEIVRALAKSSRFSDAAFSVCDPLHTKDGERRMFELGLGNVAPDQCQQPEIEAWCRTELGFDPEEERLRWGRDNYKRVMDGWNSGRRMA